MLRLFIFSPRNFHKNNQSLVIFRYEKKNLFKYRVCSKKYDFLNYKKKIELFNKRN